MDSLDRSAQVAHVLHGTRQATPDEAGCHNCGVVLCPVCAEGELCEKCDDEYQMEMSAEYEDEYRDWQEEQLAREAEEEEERQRAKKYGYY